MKRSELMQIGAYILAAALAVGGAFMISSRFLAHARAQDQGAPPDAGGDEAPPPDLAPPPPETAPPGGAAQTPPPAQGGQALPQPAAQAPAPAQPGATATNPGTPPPPAPAAGGAPRAGEPDMAGVANAANSGIAELEGFLEPFIYDIVNRRDPFQAYSEYVTPVDNEPQRVLSPAQRWDLEQLKLIGIMWDIKDPKAMFLDPEEEVMILGRDESIGNRNGYIATIREGEVVVVEAIRKRGDIIYRTRVLRIER